MILRQLPFGPGKTYLSESTLVREARSDLRARADLRRYSYDLSLALAAFYSDEPPEIVRLATIGMQHFNPAFRGYVLRLITKHVDYPFSTYFLLYIRSYLQEALSYSMDTEEDLEELEDSDDESEE